MAFTFSRIIPDNKIVKAKQSYLAIWPNNDTIDDPDWVDPQDGTKAPKVAKYSDVVWIKRKLQEELKKIYHNGLQKLATKLAEKDDPFE